MTKYLMIVNGIRFAEMIGACQKDYILRTLKNHPDITVRVIAVQVKEMTPA